MAPQPQSQTPKDKELKQRQHEKFGQAPSQVGREEREGYKSLEEQAEETRRASSSDRGRENSPETDFDKQESMIEDEVESENETTNRANKNSRQQPVR